MTTMEAALRAALRAGLETSKLPDDTAERARQWQLTGWSIEYCRTWWYVGFWDVDDALDTLDRIGVATYHGEENHDQSGSTGRHQQDRQAGK